MFPVMVLHRHLFIFTLVIFGVLFSSRISLAAPALTLLWKDNSTNESGFVIERKLSTSKKYNPVAEVGQNVTSYIDNNVTAGSRYCYRVQAFNKKGKSLYSNEACGSIATQNTLMSVAVSVVGQGKVTSNPTGISCAPTCVKSFPRGTKVGLTVTPTAGWQFQGWGGSCVGKTTTCSLSLDEVKNVTASFIQLNNGEGSVTNPQIGTFRDGTWWIDNGNWTKDSCTIDTCASFGTSGDVPVIGHWVKGGNKKIGVFRKGFWVLDVNGNSRFDGCAGGDDCFSFGASHEQGVVGDLNGDGQSEIGVFSKGTWRFDTGNHRWDDCTVDICISGFGLAGDQPVVGDWNGDGRFEIGAFRRGRWYLDTNGNRRWDGCRVDTCFNFGSSGDRAVVGDWNNDGKTQVGVFRRGEWYLDNGDRVWRGCTSDKCGKGLGANGDLPVSR